MAGVVLESLSRVYPGGVTAVSRLDLEVNDHELLVLVGPSGCGKSTTLRMIAGLEPISSGQVRLGGRVVNDMAARDRNIAMVFQNEALYPHWSVFENLAFGWRLREGLGWWRWGSRRVSGQDGRGRESDPPVEQRVREVAAVLGLAPLLERRPWQLSGGERQRVALGRALVREPAVLLLDEPLANLDAPWRVELRRELKRLHARRRTTTIYVTHDQVEALSVGDRIAVLERGVLQQVGTPLEVYDGPKNRFVAGFIGSPPMSFVEVEIGAKDGQVVARFAGANWPAPAEVATRLKKYGGKKVTCGIRPEDVQVVEGNEQAINAMRMDAGVLTGRVALVEPLGDATIVNVDVGNRNEHQTTDVHNRLIIAAKTEARTNLRTGDAAHVVMNMRRAHWFDVDTGENLILS